jgi:hypothetical protein
MKTLEICTEKTNKEFDAFVLNTKAYAQYKKISCSNENEESAVKEIAKMIFGDIVFKYKKTREATNIGNAIWTIELVEPISETEKTAIYEIKPKSRASDMKKSRAKASFLRDVRLTPKAEANLKKMCESTGLNKTQVINKLLEEQEQLKLL